MIRRFDIRSREIKRRNSYLTVAEGPVPNGETERPRMERPSRETTSGANDSMRRTIYLGQRRIFDHCRSRASDQKIS